jgi:hypothetical protein
MKTYTLILTILLSLFTILSCNNDDDNPTQQPEPHSIEGKWSLVSTKIDWSEPHLFNEGEVLWDFQPGQIHIQINSQEVIPDYVLYPFHISGEFASYEINDEINEIKISVYYLDEQPRIYIYPYEIVSDTLKIGYEFSSTGGVSLKTFVKM